MWLDAKKNNPLLDLMKSGSIQFDYAGFSFVAKREKGRFFSFSTVVYSGGNYVPKSVRQALYPLPCFHQDAAISANIFICEQEYQIFLEAKTDVSLLGPLLHFLELFVDLAVEWRYYLEEYEKRDFIHVSI